MTTPSSVLLERIQVATGEVAEAEAEIESLIQALRAQSRAEKTQVSAVLESAFLKLRAARTHLEALQHLLPG